MQQNAVVTAIANASTKTAAICILTERGISVPKVVRKGTLNDVVVHFATVMETGKDKTRAHAAAIAAYTRNAESKDADCFNSETFLKCKEMVLDLTNTILDQSPSYTTHDVVTGKNKFVTLKFPVVPTLTLQMGKVNTALVDIAECYPEHKVKVEKTRDNMGLLVRIYA